MFAYVCACVSGCSLVNKSCFSACAHANAEVGGGSEGQVFVVARYERDVFHVYIMNINYCHLWKVLALVDHLC